MDKFLGVVNTFDANIAFTNVSSVYFLHSAGLRFPYLSLGVIILVTVHELDHSRGQEMQSFKFLLSEEL